MPVDAQDPPVGRDPRHVTLVRRELVRRWLWRQPDGRRTAERPPAPRDAVRRPPVPRARAG